MPKFSIVARGSIYIDWTATQLDGLYIAQPNPGASPQVGAGVASDTGIIWTCHNNQPTTSSNPNQAYLAANCLANNRRLVINGAFIAKQINLLRAPGDLTNAPVDEGASCSSAALPPLCAAEVINYTSSMVVGGPFFGPTTGPGSGEIQSLISLPPVF